MRHYQLFRELILKKRVGKFELKFFTMSVKLTNTLITNNDTGFSSTGVANGGRFINRDGSYNLRKTGWPVWDRMSLYHMMISMKLWKFVTVIFVFYIVINLLYTLIYFSIGINEFTGAPINLRLEMFKELYFFSTETFTTVGYGRINPVGDGANFVASIEAMTGFFLLPGNRSYLWTIYQTEGTSCFQ